MLFFYCYYKFYSMKIKVLPFLLLCFLLGFQLNTGSAQVNLYKRSFLELKFGVGGTIFLGDLGGSNGRGKIGVSDFDMSSLRGNTSFGLKINLSNKFSLRGDFFRAQVAGDDKHSGDPSRRDRNLSFRSNITEFSLTAELVSVNLAKFSRNKTNTFELYSFAGVGWMRFNPQAQYEGKWYDLQPLSTEGQGLVNGKEVYSLNSMVIPFGVGFRKNIAKSTFIGIELSMRKSNTDYIDDVSGTYVSYDVLRENKGEVAANLSNRSLSGRPNTGSYRGNPNQNDNYSFVQLTIAKGFGKSSAKQQIQALTINGAKPRVKCPKFK